MPPDCTCQPKKIRKIRYFYKIFSNLFLFLSVEKNSSSVFFARLLTAGTVIDFEIQSKVIKYETGHDRHS